MAAVRLPDNQEDREVYLREHNAASFIAARRARRATGSSSASARVSRWPFGFCLRPVVRTIDLYKTIWHSMQNPRYIIVEGSLDWADRYREFVRKSYLSAYSRPELGLTEDLFSGEIFNSARIIKYFRDICEDKDDNKTWLAIDDNQELIGVVGAHKYKDFCEIKAFYVEDELQGQGIGRALYEKVLQFAGGMAMQLDVVNFMDKTISMYERWGFTIDTSREAFEYPWEEWQPGPAQTMKAIYMTKPRSK